MRQIPIAFLIAATATVATAQSTSSAGGPPPAQQAPIPCEQNPKFREFDYWVGEWEVTPTPPPGSPAPPAGRPKPQSRIEKILAGCVILENWMPPQGPGGKSFNIFNREKQRWEQIWVDGVGSIVYFHGGLTNGNMEFTSESALPNGQVQLGKMSYFKVSPDSVRQVWENSTDGGKTWTRAFDGMYVRKAAAKP
ncbi:MAG: hypothetical protein P3A28_04005 [Gemmatimonadota bacterium]|nr:hypothetical protein [Gemmatimonadota bacterium]